jgi:acetolactate synthase-1/3 small subunit
MRHVLSLLVENEAGALSRIAGLFSARGYNIESLSVAPTHDPTLSRMTLVTSGNDQIIEQITKQLNKLIDVVTVQDLSQTKGAIERELILVKVASQGAMREELKRLADIFRGNIIDVTEHSYTIELTGSSDKIDGFLTALPNHLILEVVRSGPIGTRRGAESLQSQFLPIPNPEKENV